MPAEAVLAAIQALLKALKPLGLSFALVGGLALAVWRHPRFTKDVDIVLALGSVTREELLAALRVAGFSMKHGSGSVKLGEFEILQLCYEPPGALVDVQVDILLAGDDYQRQAVKRRRRIDVPEFGMEVDVLSCEDVIVYKLMAGRIIDFADAANLLRINHESLDIAYLTSWVAAQRVSVEFAQVWREALPAEPLPG